MPFTCQPPSSFAARPLLAHDLPAPKGSSASHATRRFWVRSKPARARLRATAAGVLNVSPPPVSSVQSMAFDHVYASFSITPFENRRSALSCSESYLLG